MARVTLPPVDALPLIEATDDALIALLRGLEGEAWEQSAVGSWSVRDVAAHLLDANLRRLSFLRDGLTPPPPPSDEPIEDHPGLVRFLDRLNDDWVRAAKRLSGRVITDWLDETNPQARASLERLDPEGEAHFPVAWAGQDATKAWLDIAREYTEKWHHQQQIRRAVGAPGLTGRRFVEPLLETLVRALPRAYAGVARPSPEDVAVLILVTDLPGCGFRLESHGAAWTLAPARERGTEPRTTIALPSETAWRFLMKGMSREDALAATTVEGDPRFAEPFFAARAVMA